MVIATSAQPFDIRATLRRHVRIARSSDFVSKVAGTYATRVFLMGVNLATAVVVARVLGPEARGFYAVAAAVGALGVQFGTLGLHTSNAYFVATEPKSLPALTGNTLFVGFGFGGLIALVLGVIFTLSPTLLSIRGGTLAVGLLWIPFGLAYVLLQNLMLGVQNIRGYNLLEIANKTLPLVLIAMLVVVRRSTVPALLSATVLVMAASCVLAICQLQDYSAGQPRLSSAVFQHSIKYAVKAYLAGTFCFLVLRADLFMVQHILGPEQAGYYSIAATMADYISVLAVVIGTILFPKLSAMKDLKAKLRMTRTAAVGTGIILCPLFLVASVFARPAVKVLFGAAFLPASLAFVLLLPGMLFLGVHSVAVQFLNSIGYPKSVVIIWGACAIFNIAVNLWAIPHYGIAGASVVSSVSYFLAFVFVILVIYRKGRDVRSLDQQLA